jgi:outer membrane protein assembly factor BamB
MSRLASFLSSSAFVLLLLAPIVSRGEPNWPRWRGPHQDGHTTDTNIPVKWTDENIVWKAALPGIGQSSPIIWGDKIFLTAAISHGKERVERIVFCVSRKSGEILWKQSAWEGTPEPLHAMNTWASASCVTDGEVVVAFFGIGGIHAYSLDGNHLWSKDLGKFAGPWGTSACPVIVDDLVVQNCDADVDAHIIALDKKTGSQVWRTKRRDHRGWSTPVLVKTDKRVELVVNGHAGVQGYDPKTGKDLWFCKSFIGRGEPTVTPAGKLLAVVNGQPGDFYSVLPGGDGDVTETHMPWHTPRKSGRDCSSPIVIGNYIIVTSLDGIATCYDSADGHVYWKERIAGKFSASPIAANGLAYYLNENGKTFVIEPGDALKIVAENDITGAKDEIFRSSLTPSLGQLFVRSTTVLYCVGKK